MCFSSVTPSGSKTSEKIKDKKTPDKRYKSKIKRKTLFTCQIAKGNIPDLIVNLITPEAATRSVLVKKRCS